MPMDNNDNCYPGLSEENSKITSVLHPYDLPKFDFDHSHIRFDSLAENEGFLGISSREDDNWIEDFSRGNSGIEFGTSAAECCSIPRHVDIWSEATSSESVEMLLKSVGQEEMLPGESVIEEYNACDELSTLEKQMEVNPSPAGIKSDQDSDLEAPRVQPSDNSSGLNQGSEDVNIDPTCPSFTQGEQSASGCSVNLESSLDVRESNAQNTDSCHTKPSTSVDESSDNNMKGTLALATQRCSDSSLQNVMGDVEYLNGQDRSSANPLENESNESKQNNAYNAHDTGVCGIPDIIHRSMSEVSVFVAPNAAATQDFEKPCSIAIKEESSLPTTRGNNRDLPCAEYYVNSKDLALTGRLEIRQFTDLCEKSIAGSESDLIVNKQTALSSGVESLDIKHAIDICEKSIGGSEGDLRVDKQAASSSGVEARGVDIKCGQLKDVLSPMSHAESSAEFKECSQGRSIQVDKGASSSTSEDFIPGTEHELAIHIIVDPVNHVDNPVLSDAQQFVEEHAAENLGERNGARQHHKDTILSSVSSEIVISAEDTSQSVSEHVAENLIKRNDSMENHEDTVLPSVSSEIVMLVEAASSGREDPGDVSPKPVILDKDEARLATLSLAEEVERKIDVEQTLESDLASTLKSESNIGSNSSNAALHETSHGTTDYTGEQNGELSLIERSDVIENHEVTVLSSVSSEVVMSVEAASSGKEDPGDVSPNPVILYNDEARSLAEEVERKTDVEQTLESDIPATVKSESNIGSNGSNAASHEMSPGTTDYMGEQNGELILIKRNDAIENHEVTVLSSVSSEIVMSVEAASSGKEDPGDVSPNPVILDKNEARSSLVEEVEKKIDVEQTLESDLPSTLKSESNIGSNGSNAASHEMCHGTTDYMGEQNEELNLPSDLKPVHLDKIADTVTDAMLEEETPSLKFPLQVDSTGPLSLAEKNLDGNVSVEEEILEDSTLPLAETLNAASLNEGVTVHTKVALRFSDAMDVDGVPCDSNVVVANCPEAVLVVKHMQTKIGNSFQSELSENSGGGCLAEADKPSHTTASLTSCSKLSELDERMKEDHIESAARHLSETTPKAGEVPSVAKKDGPGEGSREERSFSFDVPPVAEKESGSMPSGSRKNRGGRKVPQVTSTVTEGGSASVGAKTTSDRKTKRGSAKSMKNNAKGNNAKQTEDNTSCTLVSYSGPAQFIQFGAGLAESRKLTTPIPTSNLPDLNTAVPTSAICHQPFTDLQQLQLRAQIFVYGSLIQGTAPDEGCMASAFGASDGGRTSWEPRWRAFIDRLHSQNAVSNNFSTPIQSHLGSKGQHKSSKQSGPRSKVVQSPVSIFCKMETPVNVKPMVPLSSPPWNLSSPSSDGLPLSNVVRGAHLALPSLHPCQTPPARTLGGQTSWLSPAPIPGPWVPSSRSSAFDLSSRYSSSQSAEVVKFSIPSDSSLAISNSMNHAFNAPSGSTNLLQDSSMQKLTSSPVGSKPRKRRKSNTTEESPQTSFLATLAVSQSDAITSNLSKKSPAVARLSSIYSNPSTSPIEGHFSTTVAVTGSPVVTVDPIHRELPMEKNSAHMGELKLVEKAKLDGEEAMAHAADLVSRCQDVWSALEEQRKSSLAPDHELKLTSSAAAVAAAASVAKAAAAAAKIASVAALHFHQVANQVLHGNASHPQESEYSLSDVSNNLTDATPASILRGGNGNDAANSVIFAAREAARRRVEDALAASQHAENLDAIVKAAELAAEAVSQAGRVVAMGKPLPLSALVEGGPENYWRGDMQLAKCSTEKGDRNDIESSKEVCKQSEGPSGLEVCTMVEGSSLPKDVARDVCQNTRVDEAISASHISGEKGLSEKRDSPAPDHNRAGNLASELADERVQGAHESNERYLNDDVIKENCIVEVFRDGGCFKGGWYSAKVLSLNEEKALVHFTDLHSDKESDSLREWIPLEGEGNNVPTIRVAHPISGVHFDRTRKRRRAAVTEYQWSVGDSVDAWSEDCWREGVITEQNSNDLTTFTVHFPAHGKTVAVKAWHLRPTLTWKNGKWIELLNSRQSAPFQGDTPRGKRLRLGSLVEVEGKQEIPKTVDNLQLGNVDEPNLLPLSSTEKVFNIGSNRGNSKVEAPRMMRSGLQKEGLKFFGVPRPGKKRKFMEVSKHLVSEESSKIDVPNDSSKLSKYLMPRGTGSRGFRSGLKADVKEKQLAESKLKAPSTGKLPGISSLTLSQKENSTAVSGPHQITSRSHRVKGSISNHARGSSDLNRFGSGSDHEVANDVPVPTQSLPPQRNKKPFKNGNPERMMKGKLAVTGGRIEGATEDKLLPDLSGPRRSNRKIQPTSRLLEGLQSSLITSKIPSVSHRLQSKGTSTRH